MFPGRYPWTAKQTLREATTYKLAIESKQFFDVQSETKIHTILPTLYCLMLKDNTCNSDGPIRKHSQKWSAR
jgi:hypothetical protein